MFARKAARLVVFGSFSLVAVLEYFLFLGWRSPSGRRAYQARWLHRQTRWINRIVNVRVTRKGAWMPAEIVVSNHLGYMDVIVLSSERPMIFVAMEEVRHWPWGGVLARCAGTIFIDRKHKRDIERVTEEIREAVAGGMAVAMFLEGTTSDGHDLLPFHSALLETAAVEGWKVQPVHLAYRSSDADDARGVSWHGNVPFFPHVWNLCGIRVIESKVSVGEPMADRNRKELAQRLYRVVRALGGLG